LIAFVDKSARILYSDVGSQLGVIATLQQRIATLEAQIAMKPKLKVTTIKNTNNDYGVQVN
jgi:hypothetical protein